MSKQHGSVRKTGKLTIYKISFSSQRLKSYNAGGNDIGRITITCLADRVIIDGIHIIKDFQGQGIGRKLIAQIIEDANNTGIPVELILLKTNPVKKLYDDLGFYLYKKDMNRYYMSTATMNTATPGKTDCSGEVMNHWEQRYQQLHRWLRPDGVLCILLMQTGAEGGPPFHCDLLKIHRLFDKQQSGCVTAEGN